MDRRKFIQNYGIMNGGLMLGGTVSPGMKSGFPALRIPADQRRFTSRAVEHAIEDFENNVSNLELAWMFGNCFPNNLDTTVTHTAKNGIPDTYVITGDIDATLYSFLIPSNFFTMVSMRQAAEMILKPDTALKS